MDDKEYISIASYQGNNSKDIYTVLKFNADSLDERIASQIKSDVKKLYCGSIDSKVSIQSNIAVDMSNVKYMDSTGLSALLILNRLNIQKYGKCIKIANCQEDVLKLLETAGFDALMNIIPDLEEL